MWVEFVGSLLNLVPRVYSSFKMAAERRPWHTLLYPPRNTPRIVEYFVT